MTRPPPLRLPAASHRRLREQAAAAWPEEACGLLAGPVAPGGGRVARLHVCANVAPERTRSYTIDPEHFLRIEHAERARGCCVLGVWHSHPHGDAAPSPRDLATAWPGWSYLIAGVTKAGSTSLRAWLLSGERFVEQPVHILGPRGHARS